MKWQIFPLLGCLLLTGCIPAIVDDSAGAFGRVTDARTHNPIPGAQVHFPASSLPPAVANSAGQYDIPYKTKLGIIVLLPIDFLNMPLIATCQGYQPVSIPVFLAAPPHQRHDFVLELEAPGPANITDSAIKR